MNNDLSYVVSVSGDYNKDGLANISDATEIATSIINNTSETNEKKYAADYDNNGQIKMKDDMRIITNSSN